MKIINTICFVTIAITPFNSNATWNKLHEAVFGQDIEKVKQVLIQQQLTPEQRTNLLNEQSADGQTPLHCAVMFGTKEVVELLLHYKPRLDIQDNVGYLPIHYTAVFGKIDMAKLFLSNGSDVDVQTPAGETPLLIAVFNMRKDAAEFFLDNNADVNTRGNNGLSPMHWAVLTNNKDMEKLLLQHNATSSSELEFNL